MRLSQFDYTYPKELIAQSPLEKRDASKMMVVARSSKTFSHHGIQEIVDYLKDGDLLIVNDSKVVPARLFGTKFGGLPLELLVVEPHDKTKGLWKCLAKKAKRMRTGDQFFFGMQSKAKVVGRDDIFLIVEFKGKALELAMKHHGAPPLPPYIERQGIETYTRQDRERYQTVYATTPGSAAAPTAGLHLSEELLEKIREKGVTIKNITLHVGIDTFAPVRADHLSEHKMHGEKFEIPKDTASEIARAKHDGRRVIAAGTTSVRALESAACGASESEFNFGKFGIRAGSFDTHLFITPGYEFRIVDAMLTNFHLPKSTLIVLVSSFAGREFILSCYEAAIKERYRLFSFGDCMLIL